MEQFKASEEDWAEIESLSKEKFGCAYKGLCDLRDRVAALEAKQAGVLLAPEATITFHMDGDDFMTTVTAPVQNKTGQYLRAGTPVPAYPRNPLASYSVGEARPLEECGKDHAVPTPPPAEPSDEELWELRRSAVLLASGYLVIPSWASVGPSDFGLRFRNAHADGNRALFDAGVAWATARAEQQATAKDSLVAEPAPADPDTPLPPIRVGQKWRLHNGDMCEVKRYAADESGPGWLIGDLWYGENHKWKRENYSSDPDGNDLAELIQDAPAPTEPAPPAPAGVLVAMIMGVTGEAEQGARAAINTIADWLAQRGNNGSAAELREEATR